eukprot:Ihof_evm2s753 gene=Ihof_evmTU2s753
MRWASVRKLLGSVRITEEAPVLTPARIEIRSALQVQQLFVEFLQATAPEIREQKLRELVIQFLLIFGDATPDEILESFNEVYTFTYHIARHVVNEVNTRGNHESLAVASQ